MEEWDAPYNSLCVPGFLDINIQSGFDIWDADNNYISVHNIVIYLIFMTTNYQFNNTNSTIIITAEWDKTETSWKKQSFL